MPRMEPLPITTAQLNKLLPTGIGAPTTTVGAARVAWTISSRAADTGFQEHSLAEKIAAGVARNTQFREEQRCRCRPQSARTRTISAALAAGSATVVRGEAQVMRTKPCWFMGYRLSRSWLGHRLVARANRDRPAGSSWDTPGDCRAGGLTEHHLRE